MKYQDNAVIVKLLNEGLFETQGGKLDTSFDLDERIRSALNAKEMKCLFHFDAVSGALVFDKVLGRDENGDFQRIKRLNRFDFNMDGSTKTIQIQDWSTDKYEISAYYCTYENGLGEGEPSEIIEIEGIGPEIYRDFTLILSLIFCSLLIPIIAIIIVVMYFILIKGGKK